MTTANAAIVPITLTVNDRTGVTLYAPPWEDEDGEQWQGFLGDGSKIVLFATTAELATFIQSGQENDLSDHPLWGQVLKARPDDLRPDTDDRYDLDAVYELASGEPDPVHVSALADVVDIVARIADVCDDGALRRLVEDTPAYAELVDEEVSYQGKDGRKRWNELGATIADSWERAIRRAADWLSWQGDYSQSEFDEEETLWERIGAEPIAMRFPEATYLTVRAELATSADQDGTTTQFLGENENVTVFTAVADLAQFCRTAKHHPLVKLEWWEELAEVDNDDDFAPEAEIDVRKPSPEGAALLRAIAAFCALEADTGALDDETIDRDDWNAVVGEVEGCLYVDD